VHVPARALGEPVADRPGFMGCVVVHDDVNVEVGRHVALDLIQEFAELVRAVAGHALADDGARFHIERRKQRCRSVPLIIVRAPLGLSGPHRQQGLRAVERLYLAFLIDTQHDSAFGRRQVEPDDIAHFLYEQRIGGKLESLDAVRLQTEGAPDAMHRRRRMTDLLNHAPEAPVGATPWARLQRFADRARDFVVANLARRAGPRLVVETVHTLVGKAVAPGADRVRADPKLRRDLFVL